MPVASLTGIAPLLFGSKSVANFALVESAAVRKKNVKFSAAGWAVEMRNGRYFGPADRANNSRGLRLRNDYFGMSEAHSKTGRIPGDRLPRQGDVKVLEQLASSAFAFNFMRSKESTLPDSPLQKFFGDSQREKLLTEDFYSHCFRLVGFGLAAQIGGDSPSDSVFGLTRRGHRLLALLKQRT